jgi:glycosidase
MSEKSVKEIEFSKLCDRKFWPSPSAWEDQVFYFLMLDRFSDGNEKGFRDNNGVLVNKGKTPAFKPPDDGNAVRTEDDAKKWREAGSKWVGGNLKGLTSKIGYLRRMGISAIWISPIFKQVAFCPTYHGYGIQNYLDVDPNFGVREDLKKLVETAHSHGIYVILDIILNHCGNVFSYNPDRYETWDTKTGIEYLDPRWDGKTYEVSGFNDGSGNPSIAFRPHDRGGSATVGPNAAIWPEEFQDPSFFTCKGRICNWDYKPEFLEGDFCDLKDVALGKGATDYYEPSAALLALSKVYQFWIAYADIDGFRVDTVKHMDPGAARFIASSIHEFAQAMGKENFYMIGEITGGRNNAFDILESTGIDAALGIDDIPGKLESLVKGYANPQEYFGLFRNSILVGKESHTWFRNKVVTVLDDHDQIRKGDCKARFCALDDRWKKLVLNALALNATTLGIPCIYYGTEQCFDGSGGNDQYIQESMFGGEFGAFRTRNAHFFDEENPVYKELAKILAIREEKIALRRGRQYLREISGDRVNFGLPVKIGEKIRSIVPWSRIFNDFETLVAINTDCENPGTAWVTVDGDIHNDNDTFDCLYSTDAEQIGRKLKVERMDDGRKVVRMDVPAAGFVIFA